MLNPSPRRRSGTFMPQTLRRGLKSRFEEFVEREYVQCKDVQAALLLFKGKLHDKLLETLVGAVTKLTTL